MHWFPRILEWIGLSPITKFTSKNIIFWWHMSIETSILKTVMNIKNEQTIYYFETLITCFKIKISCYRLNNILISKFGNLALNLNKTELNELFIAYNLLRYTFVSWRKCSLYGAPQEVILNLKRRINIKITESMSRHKRKGSDRRTTQGRIGVFSRWNEHSIHSLISSMDSYLMSII